MPESVIEELKRPRPRNPRTRAANDAAAKAVRRASDMLTNAGVEHELQGDRRGPEDPNPGEAMAREMAWIMSVTNAMKESVPRKQWCRHMKAADPHLGEIRTVCAISAGVWLCVECGRQADQMVLKANPWPDECDLCGASIEPGHFNELAFNVPGCFVNCSVCDRCASFQRTRHAA
ncbi:MAG TPA: hypothetical protein VH541_06770 [Gaiellaceae bacterium]